MKHVGDRRHFRGAVPTSWGSQSGLGVLFWADAVHKLINGE